MEDAALRETREDPGLAVGLTGLLGVYSAAGGMPTLCWPTPPRPIHDPAALRPQPEEVLEAGLLRVAEAAPLAFPHDPAILAAWQAAVD